ncbi:hypothetical protein BOX15_Mlig033434g1, partial [Macrostomum lignano]
DTLLAANPKSRRYEKIDYFDEGQYALVYKARDTHNGRLVAIKKVKSGTREDIADGVNRTALREIKLLRELLHDNVIRLLDAFGDDGNVNLVFEIMHTDLEKLVHDQSVVLSPSHIKNIVLQCLRGLDYMHANFVLHRDIKSNNIFVSATGQVKLGDFGLARMYGSPNRPLTNQVVTRWYRCPELLLGAKIYGPGVDMWAAGCVFAELLRRTALFPGESDIMQLSKIYHLLGTPNLEDWPEVAQLENYLQFKECQPVPLHDMFTAATNDLLDLMQGLLRLNPAKRLTAAEALTMPYFVMPPAPCTNQQIPLGGGGGRGFDGGVIGGVASYHSNQSATTRNHILPGSNGGSGGGLSVPPAAKVARRLQFDSGR